MSMTGNPLQIPEIIATVLQYADSRSLVAAAQVNSQWTEDATNNIWRGEGDWFKVCLANPLIGLVDCCSNERLSWYTSKIHHLWIYTIEGNDRFKSFLEEGRLEFPNARSINIYVWTLGDRHLARLLTSNIVALRLFSPFGPSILDEIKIRSPSLRFLMVYWQHEFTDDQFLDFLVRMPSITHLDGNDNRDALAGPKLLHHMALQPYFMSLPFVESTIFEPIALGHTVLPALQILKVMVKQEHGILLLSALRMMKQLRSLTLDSWSECPPLMLEWMSIYCPRLEEFTVWGPARLQVTGEALVSLARGCPLLRYLNMHIGLERNHTFTDGLLDELALAVPKLEFLRLSCKLPSLSVRSLISFAINCPRLYSLDLPGIFELTNLIDEPSDIKFPFLQFLTIDHTKPAISRRRTGVDGARLERRRERVIAVLDARFPALREFEMSAGKNEFYDRVNKHLRQTRTDDVEASPCISVKEELTKAIFSKR